MYSELPFRIFTFQQTVMEVFVMSSEVMSMLCIHVYCAEVSNEDVEIDDSGVFKHKGLTVLLVK